MINTKSKKGFSLIELMIALAIIGILGIVVYPSYIKMVRTGDRADVLAQLMEVAIEMEQFKAANNTYAGAAAGGSDTGVPDPNLIMRLDDKVATNYTVTISSADRYSYWLKAAPKGSQLGDECGVITLDMNGNFYFAPLDGTPAPDSCKK